MPRPRRRVRGLRRVARALAGAAGAGLLALAMALLINLGLLGAIGSPAGPGGLGLPPVVLADAEKAPAPSVSAPCRRGGQAAPLVREAPTHGCSGSPAFTVPTAPTAPPADDAGDRPGTANADD